MPETNYFWDEMEDNVMEEFDENGNTIVAYDNEPALYGSVLSQDRGGEKRYFHFDGQGSTTELTDSTGAVTDLRRFSAFGDSMETSGSTAFPFQYCGAVGYYALGDAPRTYYVRARLLFTQLHRWSSQDPLSLHTSAHAYIYVLSRPLDLVDPSGLRGAPVRDLPGYGRPGPGVRPRPGGRPGPTWYPSRGDPATSPIPGTGYGRPILGGVDRWFPPSNADNSDRAYPDIPLPPGWPQFELSRPGSIERYTYAMKCQQRHMKCGDLPMCHSPCFNHISEGNAFLRSMRFHSNLDPDYDYVLSQCEVVPDLETRPPINCGNAVTGVAQRGRLIHCTVLVRTPLTRWVTESQCVSITLCPCCIGPPFVVSGCVIPHGPAGTPGRPHFATHCNVSELTTPPPR